MITHFFTFIQNTTFYSNSLDGSLFKLDLLGLIFLWIFQLRVEGLLDFAVL